MAICEGCGLEMMEAEGCTVSEIALDGLIHTRLKDTMCGEFEIGKRCHDCNAAPGNFHHLSCDNEPCPACDGQLFVCDCEKEL